MLLAGLRMLIGTGGMDFITTFIGCNLLLVQCSRLERYSPRWGGYMPM
jgi:hypothetical protein